MAIRASFRKFILTLVTAAMLPCVSFAQTEPSFPTAASRSPSVTSVRRNIAIVFLAGIGGAILGLSTLSFYSDPPNHVSNISTGLVLGLLGGAGYLIGEAYSRPKMESSLGLDPLQDLQAKAVAPVIRSPLLDLSF